MTHADEVFELMVNAQWLVRGDDGMWLFWPPSWCKGALTSSTLRRIASRMDRENRANRERIAAALTALNGEDERA